MRKWITALAGIVFENASTADLLKAKLAELLELRRCLLIIDDVWHHTSAKFFQVGGPRCRVLMTTRDTAVIEELGAKTYSIPVMTDTEAVQLLTEWSGGSLANATYANPTALTD